MDRRGHRYSVDVRAMLTRRASSLAILVLAHCLVLLALTPFLSVGTPWTNDEGLYARQAQQLVDGSWEYQWTGADVDPSLASMPYINPDRNADPVFLYVRHPLWPTAMAATFSLAGDRYGPLIMLLPSLVLMSIGTWLLARELAPSTKNWAYVLSALAPAAVNGWVWWAHAPAGAAAAFAWWAAVRARKGHYGITEAATLAAATMFGCLVRSEALLLSAALVLVLGALGLLHRSRSSVLAGLTVGVAAAASVAIERFWTNSIVGIPLDSIGVRSNGDWVTERFSGAWHVLFQSTEAGGESALVLLLVGGVAVGAAVAVRRNRAGYAVAGLTVLAIAYVLRISSNFTEPITGLVPAWPAFVIGLAVAGAIAFPWSRHDRMFVFATGGCFVGALLLTQYGEGGGLEWGGRFLVPMAPILACAAAPGLAALFAVVKGRPLGVVALAAVVVVPFGAGLLHTTYWRSHQASVNAEILAVDPQVLIVQPSGFGRAAWRLDRDGRQIFLARTEADFVRLSEALTKRGVDQVYVVQVSEVAYLEGCRLTSSLGGLDLMLDRVTLDDPACRAEFTGTGP